MKTGNPDRKRPFAEFYSIGLLFILSFLFRFAMLKSISGTSHMYLAIHGSLKEITIPFSLLVISFYYQSDFLKKMTQWSILIFSLLICCDCFNVYYLGIRIHKELLNDGILVGWPIKQRVMLASSMGITYLLLSRLNSKSGLPGLNSPKRNSLLAIASIALLSLSFLFPTFTYNPELIAWEHFFGMYYNHKRLQITRTSYECLFLFSNKELQIDLAEIYRSSDYSSFYKDRFAETARNKIASSRIKKPETWLHLQNTSEQAKKAFYNSFAGIETDLHFVPEKKMFLVCHDWPDTAESANRYENLNHFLIAIEPFLQENKKIWFDMKNLNLFNINDAITCLQHNSTIKENTQKIWFESPNPFIIRELSQAGFQTIQSFFYGNTKAKITDNNLPEIQSLTAFSKADMISLPWQLYSKNIHKQLQYFPLALYTFETSDELAKFSSAESIQILLTDVNSRTNLNDKQQ